MMAMGLRGIVAKGNELVYRGFVIISIRIFNFAKLDFIGH